jgi:hypothetical protein
MNSHDMTDAQTESAIRKMIFAAKKSKTKDYDVLTAVSKVTGVRLALLLALAVRETDIRNIEGDRGNGKGLLQIDARYHSIARNDRWRWEPYNLALYGGRLLASNIAWARDQFPSYQDWQHEKIALAAYNCGRAGVAGSSIFSGDCDSRTTGKNYGADVLRMSKIIEKIFREEEAHNAESK